MIYQKAADTDLIEAVTDLENLSRQARGQTRVRLDNLILEQNDAVPTLTQDENGKLEMLAQARIKTTFKSLREDAAEEWRKLEADMDAAISEFSAGYYQAILDDRDALSDLKRGESYHCDLDPLRATLQEKYSVGFEAIRNRLVDGIVVLNKTLGAEFCDEIRKHMESVQANTWFLATLLPKTDGLNRTVLLDLTAGWLSGIMGFSKGKIHKTVKATENQLKDICSEMMVKGQKEINAAVERLAGEYIADASRHLKVFAAQGNDGKIHTRQEKRSLKRGIQQIAGELQTAEMLVETLVEIRAMLEGTEVRI